ATADSHGECDCSFRAGLPGFVHVLDAKTLIYPEYRGNGVLASLGNIAENPHIGMFLADFLQSTVGLHINGTAQTLENDALRRRPDLPEEVRLTRRAMHATVIKDAGRDVPVHSQSRGLTTNVATIGRGSYVHTACLFPPY